MTIRQKFSEFTKQEVWENENKNAEECELIADEFAIKFAEWVGKLRSSEIDTIDYDLYLRYNTKELLEIYKKEIK